MRKRSDQHLRRIEREFRRLEEQFPQYRGMIRALRERRYRLVRIPVALVLMMGSFLAVLPVFGMWMFPLGLMLLSIDVPFLRPFVARILVLARRRISLWWVAIKRRRANRRAR